jgi:hypothetical protein
MAKENEEELISPSGVSKALGKATIKASPKILKEYSKTAGQTGLWSKVRPILKGVGVKGFAIATLVLVATAIAYWGINQAKEKMGPPTDLSRYLPDKNKIIWITAPFTRLSRDDDPYFEPNIVAEKITIKSSADNIFAFGISLQGLPELFTNDVDINELGIGNSDWLCESFRGYLICRSMSLSHPLEKDKISEITLFFHLPGYEMERMLQIKNGNLPAYLIVGKK